MPAEMGFLLEPSKSCSFIINTWIYRCGFSGSSPYTRQLG